MFTVFAAALAMSPVEATLKLVASKPLVGVRAINISAAPTGTKFAITAEDNSVRIYDAATRQLIKTMTGHPQQAMAIAWSQDGTMIATGDESARIFVWSASTGAKLRELRGHQRGIQNLCFNYPRTLLLSTGKDDAMKVWDLSTGKVKATILGKGANFFGGTFKAKGNDIGVGVLNIGGRLYGPDFKVKGFLTGHGGQGVFDIDFNKAGTRALTCGKDGNGAIWDVKAMSRLNYLRGHKDWVVWGNFSPNGKYVATSSTDTTVRVWNIYSYRPELVFENQSSLGSPLAWTGNGKYLITVNLDGFLTVNEIAPAQG
ncbi:MAG: WD40 repeat domain-containing protein [Fimbriimonadaceae bacterium]|nr:WD40 repeat domain-containing protein [Fimbriimonadaceae bacterium]